ncbi:MAG: PKD domain-containing protein, partial [Candidatus Hydrogenedentes bacterium]|nr:PKD domain-containing protein [Candidatus Hydrogenedentota bacterium]
MDTSRWIAGLSIFAALSCVAQAAGGISIPAQPTLAAVELNRSDTLRFTLLNGETRTLTVDSTEARVILTNLSELKQGITGGQTVYEMSCRVLVDGHPMTMRRFVPAQQSFYEPYVINGMRIWFDGVLDAGRILTDNHGGGLPRKDARFAVQDMTLPICPQPIRPWYPNPENCIDVADSYEANDVWMGPYRGAELHGGLDVNMPIGTPLWAPIDFDTQYYFNSLEMGHNNNRWRGVRTWENGQRWVLQTHHMVRLLVPEHTPLKQGTHFAEAAGVLTGTHAHSHFVFKIGPEDNETLLDPWVLFWQCFENNRLQAGEIRAEMRPCSPATVGVPVQFDGSPSRPGITGNVLRYRWTFGDGGTAVECQPQHVYVEPGIYPVTLTVSDGARNSTRTQHITVDSGTLAIDQPAIVLDSPEAMAFRVRPVSALDVYAQEPAFEPFTLQFTARPETSPRPAAQHVRVRSAASGTLTEPLLSIVYRPGRDWLSVTREGEGLAVAVDAAALPNRHGVYLADVAVDCPGALNSPQVFSVQLEVPSQRNLPSSSVTVDNLDTGCYTTPWSWLATQFHRHNPDHWKPGYHGDYLIYGGRMGDDDFVRFSPDLASGRYVVSFSEETPFQPSPIGLLEPRFA